MSELNTQQLKDYLKAVFDLEGALYQHQQLVDGYISHRKKRVPIAPTPKLPAAPTKPVPQSTKLEKTEMTPQMLLSTIGFITTGFFGFFYIFFSMDMAGEYGWEKYSDNFMLGLILAPISVLCFVLMRKEIKRQEQQLQIGNQHQNDEYEKAMESHRNEVERAQKEHSSKLQVYNKQLFEYTDATNKQLKKLEEIKTTLQNTLTELYSQNIIYAKYRNLVAISTIYEYFESGRCTELEGPNGAYNMYEGELRSNIIICSLSQVISDLEQIKNGQYALYEQIRSSNEKVTYLLNDIYNAQKLTAYYAEAAAKAASAKKIIYGRIYH